jgi:hypothetical protein
MRQPSLKLVSFHKGFLLSATRTPHDSKHLHGWRGMEHAHWKDQPVRSRLVKVLEQA